MTVLDESLATLRGTCGQFLFEGFDIAVPYAGLATGTVPAFEATLSGYVRPGADAPDDANGLRMHLLGRGHDLVAVLTGDGWVLNSSPRFEFSGSLKHGTWTTALRLLEPPAEYGIKLAVAVTLVR